MRSGQHYYTECGLANVWLANGFTKKKTAYGEAVSITHADTLHKLLAEDLINKPARLTGKELRFLRVMLKLSQAAVAKMQGVLEQNISLRERLLYQRIVAETTGKASSSKVKETENDERFTLAA